MDRIDTIAPLFHVDAFAEGPFTGNPAAVCLLPDVGDDRWMQFFAAEMNLSETAYIVPGQQAFDLRWFTPRCEVDLCGHATLASAHVLWEQGMADLTAPISFSTRSGILRATWVGPFIELDFPATPCVPAEVPAALVESIGPRPLFVGRNKFDYLLEVEDETTVRELKPDFAALGRVQARGCIVTSRSDSASHDFVSRFFAPAVGVNEDPVTGSAHCCLGPYWSQRLGKTDLVGYQASARGGEVRVRVAGPRVFLGGKAVTVVKGEVMA
jgi:predicted PhzF superfamily epimerase YddE/YHI9